MRPNAKRVAPFESHPLHSFLCLTARAQYSAGRAIAGLMLGGVI